MIHLRRRRVRAEEGLIGHMLPEFRILPPAAYRVDERFGLITNFDSLTEMATEMAQPAAEQQLHGAARLTDRFLR
jgi:hypothetical protein